MVSWARCWRRINCSRVHGKVAHHLLLRPPSDSALCAPATEREFERLMLDNLGLGLSLEGSAAGAGEFFISNKRTFSCNSRLAFLQHSDENMILKLQ